MWSGVIDDVIWSGMVDGVVRVMDEVDRDEK